MWLRDSKNTLMGDRNEKDVLNWLRSLGYSAELYRMENGGAQIKTFEGDPRKYVYPDIEVYTDPNFLNLKFLVEVKSFTEECLERDNYIRKSQNVFVPKDKYGVAIKVNSFLSYLELKNKYDLKVRIIFIVESTGNWYWQNVDVLNDCRRYAEDMFSTGENFYFWRFEKLRTDFKNR